MMEDNNLILIFVSLVAGQVSWGMEEPTWSEYIQTGVTFFTFSQTFSQTFSNV